MTQLTIYELWSTWGHISYIRCVCHELYACGFTWVGACLQYEGVRLLDEIQLSGNVAGSQWVVSCDHDHLDTETEAWWEQSGMMGITECWNEHVQMSDVSLDQSWKHLVRPKHAEWWLIVFFVPHSHGVMPPGSPWWPCGCRSSGGKRRPWNRQSAGRTPVPLVRSPSPRKREREWKESNSSAVILTELDLLSSSCKRRQK